MTALAVAFRNQLVRPTITRLGLWSEAAETLLMMTAAHESAGWMYVQQSPSRIAKGLFQHEPDTLADLFENWLRFRPQWRDKLAHEFNATAPQPDRLVFDSWYACAMARMQYYRDPAPLPPPDDLDALAALAKRVWNGPGAATPAMYLAAYREHCG